MRNKMLIENGIKVGKSTQSKQLLKNTK